MVKVALVNWVLLGVLLFGMSPHLAAFIPVDNYLIACGSSQNVTFQGRTFVPDSAQFLPVLKPGVSSVATANSSVPFSIYEFARVFSGIASYSFDIKQKGRHWIRLYFYPVLNSGHDLKSVPLTVVTDDFVLLNNFTFKNYNGSYLFREFAVNVTSSELTLTFIPQNNSVSFVNAIEVVSVPDELLPDQALAVSRSTGPFGGLSELAFETVSRLNMGGPLITGENDTLGRTWENDAKYLHDNSSAVNVSTNSSINYQDTALNFITPEQVYATAKTRGKVNVPDVGLNITWVFPVDPDFMYFVRFHLCDIVSKSMNSLFFNLYINSNIAAASLDLSALTGGLGLPYYNDFVSNSSDRTDILTVSVGPDLLADVRGAILNGLEIMKISNEAKSLDGLSSVKTLLPEPTSKRSSIFVVVGCVSGAVVLIGLAVFCYCCLVARTSKTVHYQGHPRLPLLLCANLRKMTKLSTTCQQSTAGCISLASTSLCRSFTFQEILDATNKFDERLLLGVGGFGRVYKGTLEDGMKVAVKRGDPRSKQGLAEFRTEIEMLSNFRHRHLVSLIGYCDEPSEMILVYEYMANGPLKRHLYGTDLPSLSWKQRLEICIGAARGLHYLHTGAAQTQSIIHRDIKTTNILLNENFVAKVADFGLSKAGPSLDQTHVSTAVKGTFGYLDPEYFRRQQLTEKTDVYSFGVVLMEVLCGRPALDHVLPTEQENIAAWAITWQKKGMLDQIIDPNLVGKVNPASLRKFGETAEKCLAEHGVDRPSMGKVLWNLEDALELEVTFSALMEPEDNLTNHIPSIPLTPQEPFDNIVRMIDGEISSTNDDAEVAATSGDFSQLVEPLMSYPDSISFELNL